MGLVSRESDSNCKTSDLNKVCRHPDRQTQSPRLQASGANKNSSKTNHSASQWCSQTANTTISLHWLDVPERLQYKLGVTVRRCQQHKAPQYLTDCVTSASGIASRRRLALPVVTNFLCREWSTVGAKAQRTTESALGDDERLRAFLQERSLTRLSPGLGGRCLLSRTWYWRLSVLILALAVTVVVPSCAALPTQLTWSSVLCCYWTNDLEFAVGWPPRSDV